MALRSIVNKLFSKKYLVVTNTLTGTLFLSAGDFIDQYFTQTEKIDVKRIEGMAITGTYFGFLGHFWYRFLDRKFTSVPRKLLADAAIGPPFGASLFFIVGFLENKPVPKIVEDLRSNLALLCLADWCFYIPLQAINFRYLPSRFRFLYVAAISLVYDTFLAHLLHRSSDQSSKSKSESKSKLVSANSSK